MTYSNINIIFYLQPDMGKEEQMTKEEFSAIYPNLVFVKTKKHIDSQGELHQENFIFDDDTPTLVKDVSVVMPLSITDFPNVLKSMTATDAGLWAVSKCQQQKWEISRDNIESCLANLEMDM